MKKILMALVCMIALLFTACTSTGNTATELTYDKDNDDVVAEDFDNNLDGLADYLEEKTLIGGEAFEMSYDFISAIGGEKYFFVSEGITMSCELYEYDLENMDDKANEVINSIKENGYFMSLDTQVEAILSDNGKYVMVLGGEVENDAVKEQTEDLKESFNEFYK